MSVKISAKPAKGTKDLFPQDVYLRRNIINLLIPIYEKYGGVPIQTPILERMDIVTGLYGEEFDKSVFKIDETKNEDQTEKLLLRYDLTVPFARFLADNGIIVYKRYQIGPVYRRDNVNANKGRMREFYQADFDIIGNDTDQMIQETEILSLLTECLESLLLVDSFTIMINSREILFSMLKNIGIDDTLMLSICSTLDKLDKFSPEEWEMKIREELVQKKIPNNNIDEVIKYITTFNNGQAMSNIDRLNTLKTNKYITDDTYNRMLTLLNYLDGVGISKYINFSPTLSRGLDYYTGLIYEATYNDKNIMPSSIAAGGRYNGMIGKLSNKKNITAIGVSIGIERIVTIKETQGFKTKLPKPKVFVASVGKDMMGERLKLVCTLRRNGIYADMSYSTNPKMKGQFEKVFEDGIEYMIVIGENEIQKNTVMLKNIYTKEQQELDRNEAIKFLLK